MKKFLALLIALIMCMVLCACGGNSDTADAYADSKDNEKNNSVDEDKDNKDDDDKADADKNDADKDEVPVAKDGVLSLNKRYSVKDYADFKMIKVQTSDRIESPFGNSYYSCPEGNQYVDIILEVTNTRTVNIDTDEFAIIKATGSTGIEYTSSFFGVETSDRIDKYTNIIPLATAKLHCAVSVPLSETAVNITLTVNENVFTLKYKINDVISYAETLTVNQTIENKDYADLKFKGIEYTDDLLPSNTSGVYSHYDIDDVSNTYLVAKFDITSYLATSKDCDEFISVKAKYMNKYTYSGFVVMEDTDGKGFSSYDSIDPLSTRSLYYLIEIPKTVMENEVELTIYFNGTDYIFKG